MAISAIVGKILVNLLMNKLQGGADKKGAAMDLLLKQAGAGAYPTEKPQSATILPKGEPLGMGAIIRQPPSSGEVGRRMTAERLFGEGAHEGLQRISKVKADIMERQAREASFGRGIKLFDQMDKQVGTMQKVLSNRDISPNVQQEMINLGNNGIKRLQEIGALPSSFIGKFNRFADVAENTKVWSDAKLEMFMQTKKRFDADATPGTKHSLDKAFSRLPGNMQKGMEYIMTEANTKLKEKEKPTGAIGRQFFDIYGTKAKTPEQLAGFKQDSMAPIDLKLKKATLANKEAINKHRGLAETKKLDPLFIKATAMAKQEIAKEDPIFGDTPEEKQARYSNLVIGYYESLKKAHSGGGRPTSRGGRMSMQDIEKRMMLGR